MQSPPHTQNQTHMPFSPLYSLLCNVCAKLCQWGNNYLLVTCCESRGMFKTGQPLDLWGRGAKSLPPLPLALMSPAGRGLHNTVWPSQCMTKRMLFCKGNTGGITFWGSFCGLGWELASVLLTCSRHVCCKFHWRCYCTLPQRSG